MCNCTSSVLGNDSTRLNGRVSPNRASINGPSIGNNSLIGKRFSNMTTSKAEELCSEEVNADLYTSDVAYYNAFNACVSAKKAAALNKTIGWIDQGNNFLKNLGTVLGTFNTPPPPPDTYGPGIPTPEPKGLSAGAWIGIIGGVLLVGIVAVVIVKSGKAKNGK